MARVEKLYITVPGAPPGSAQAYLIAVLAMAGATALRNILSAFLAGVPFVTYFPVLIAVTLLLGGRAGLAAAVAATFMAWWLVLPGRGPWHVLSVEMTLGLVIFLVIALTAVGLVAALRHAVYRYRELNAELEARVAERSRELERAQAELVQAHKMEAVGQLTGGVAHDFNNMLAVILGGLELAQRRLPDRGGEAAPHLDHAAEAARRASQLTQRLLAFARRQPLAPEVVDVNRLVGGTCELLRSTLGRTVTIECVLAGGLWRTSVDAAQLESALVNLAVNARDAMPAGGRLTIETVNAHLDEAYAATHQEVRPGQYVQIAVSDTGEGMTQDVAARVFEPFFTTKPVGRGTGLGLSQVYGFVKQSGGHVKVYSEPGQGTTLKLYLPRWLGDETPQPTPRPPPPAAGTGQVVLVVEDEPQVRRISTDSLRALGYGVVAVSGGGEALALLETGAPVDLLFTDVVMPEMSGRELADRALALRPDLKVLFTTGYTRNAIVHNGTVEPGVHLLSKPYTLEQLSRKVREVLAGA